MEQIKHTGQQALSQQAKAVLVQKEDRVVLKAFIGPNSYEIAQGTLKAEQDYIAELTFDRAVCQKIGAGQKNIEGFLMIPKTRKSKGTKK